MDGVIQSEYRFPTATRATSSDEAQRVGALVEIQRPLGDRTQFSIYERALVDVGADRAGIEVLGNLHFMHLIGERWMFSLYAMHRREIFDDDFVLSSWDAGAGRPASDRRGPAARSTGTAS